MDSRQLTQAWSITRNSSKQAMPSSLNLTWSFIGTVWGHSRQPGQDKDFNEQTDALAKAGTLHGESWTFHVLPPNPSVAAVTCRQHATGPHTPPTLPYHLVCCWWSPHPPICGSHTTNYGCTHSDPLTHPISTSDLATSAEFNTLHSIKHMLHLREGVLTYVPEPLTCIKACRTSRPKGDDADTTKMMHQCARKHMKHSSK